MQNLTVQKTITTFAQVLVSVVLTIIIGSNETRSINELWFISQLPLQALSSGIVCDNIPGLIGKQRRICRSFRNVMVSIGQGTLEGLNECQYQFQKHRWNCSTLDRDASLFGKVVLKVGTREAAFVYSISSAGVVYYITRACSLGHLSTCACDPSKTGRSRDRNGQWFEWGGCSDDVEYGRRFAKTFIDAKERKNMDARALMNLHNNQAGRQAVKKLGKLQCKCHGISGSCTLRTCWRAMREFRRVGTFLKHKYNGAIQVTMNQNAGESELIVANRNYKKPTKYDLIYFDESSDYCVRDLQLGSLGTDGRECKISSADTDGCDIMCCGRGYNTIFVKRIDKCECKFHWCCDVICKNCTKTVEQHRCKGPIPTNVPTTAIALKTKSIIGLRTDRDIEL